MSEASPDREEQLRRLRRWLAVSDRLDRLIEATEPPHRTQPLPVRAAKAAGMASVGLASTGRTRQLLAEADLVIDSLAELSPSILRELILRAGS